MPVRRFRLCGDGCLVVFVRVAVGADGFAIRIKEGVAALAVGGGLGTRRRIAARTTVGGRPDVAAAPALGTISRASTAAATASAPTATACVIAVVAALALGLWWSSGPLGCTGLGVEARLGLRGVASGLSRLAGRSLLAGLAVVSPWSHLTRGRGRIRGSGTGFHR